MSNTHFRALLEEKHALIIPTAHDALSAKLIERTGFDCCAVGGFALVAARLGLPDIGVATFSELYAGVQDILPNLSVPLLVDADDGYGDIKNAVRTVQMYERLGVGGVLLEDQTSPKRCGHAAGKSVVSRQAARQKLEAALDARRNPDFFIVARTDARGTHGLDEALERARIFEEAGADAIFIEAPQNIGELELIGRSFRTPLLATVAEGGKSPALDAERLIALGFRMIWYPGVVLARMIVSIQDSLALIHQGSLDTPPNLPSVPQMSALLGMQQWIDLQQKYDPD
ncbi:isocitrate lyase/PEP mutase family protein [Paraburkholderia elongata]|uniref:2,3-dimethylmalate lyase n=1 Tax=Paraburkholderia elongata TaxID=2675747 RepID=A0A972NLB8_9BURK|nr:isocitrate lyase/PEP mutase family protein [Paraburkholderia elongata]NPT55081.1 2,3-dimethylmalate lyase [Paraburkholderia elongata]